MAAMYGKSMMARMIEALSTPEPLGMPEVRVSQMLPGGAADISGICTFSAKNGAKTNRPHMP